MQIVNAIHKELCSQKVEAWCALSRVHSFGPIFFDIPGNDVYLNISQEFVNQLDNCQLTLYYEKDQMMCFV
jgi:hypothetical protein